MNTYIIDPECPVFNGMGWSQERKDNVQKMFEVLRSLYPVGDISTTGANASFEVGVIFHSEKPDDGTNNIIYDIDSAVQVSRNHTSNGWDQDVEKEIRAYFERLGISYNDVMKSRSRLCVWHNHFGGGDVSESDLALLIDFFPTVRAVYTDTKSVVRATLTEHIKSEMSSSGVPDEKKRSEMLYRVRESHKKNAESLKDEINDILKSHIDPITEYAIAKEKARKNGEPYVYANEEQMALEVYGNEMDKVRAKYHAKPESENPEFRVVRFKKKEVSV